MIRAIYSHTVVRQFPYVRQSYDTDTRMHRLLTGHRNVAHVRPVRTTGHRFATLVVNKSYRRYAVCRTISVVTYVRRTLVNSHPESSAGRSKMLPRCDWNLQARGENLNVKSFAAGQAHIDIHGSVDPRVGSGRIKTFVNDGGSGAVENSRNYIFLFFK